MICAVAFLQLAGCGGESKLGDVVTAERTSTDDVRDCPDGLTLWPVGHCAPPISECEAWELPLATGGCLAIGPRACPKGWDPESQADCEAEELADCPEGFVLTEDEAACVPFFSRHCTDNELPTLGGACSAVGLEADLDGTGPGVPSPFFDACPPGSRAIAGGGCMPVGPRVCPVSYDPEADGDCEPGDIIPCLAGTELSADGSYCAPVYDECGDGALPMLGGGCQAIGPALEDCPTGPFPEVPGDAEQVVYVQAGSGCTIDCGTMKEPFSSIAAAVAAVESGGYVLVAAGTYDEGVLIKKPVHLIGLCPALVHLTGSKGPPPLLGTNYWAGIGINLSDGVEIKGLSISGDSPGIVIRHSSQVDLQELWLGPLVGVGVYVADQSDVSIRNLWVRNLASTYQVFAQGAGVWILEGSAAEISDSLLESNSGSGCRIDGQDSVLAMKSSVIRSTFPDANGGQGFGLVVAAGAMADVEQVLLDGNSGSGLMVSGAQAKLESCAILNTVAGIDELVEAGVRAQAGAIVDLADCLVEGNAVGGVDGRGVGTQVTLMTTTIRNSHPGSMGQCGQGLSVWDGAKCVLRGCLVEDNLGNGIAATGTGALIELTGTLVRNTAPVEEEERSSGLLAEHGGQVFVGDSLIEANVGYGAVAFDAGSLLAMEKSTIRDSGPGLDGVGGRGVAVESGAGAVIEECLVEANTEFGIAAFDPGTSVEVSQSVVRQTSGTGAADLPAGMAVGGGAFARIEETQLSENSCRGVVVVGEGTVVEMAHTLIEDTVVSGDIYNDSGLAIDGGASVLAQGCRFARNSGLGVLVGGVSSHLELSGSVIEDSRADSQVPLGWGVAVKEGGGAQISHTLVLGNRVVGIGASGAGTIANLRGVAVADTICVETDGMGAGLLVQKGAGMWASSSLLNRNSDFGLAVSDVGSTVQLTDSAVVDSFALDGETGWGLLGFGGALIDVSGCLFASNRGFGANVWDTETALDVRRSVVIDTHPAEDQFAGIALAVQGGAQLRVSGCLIDGNAQAGAVAADAETTGTFSGTIIRNTTANETGGLGVGAAALGGAEMAIRHCLVLKNMTAGVVAWISETRVRLSASAVLDTGRGGRQAGAEFEVYGDGVVAREATLDLDRCVIMGNGRAGAYFADGAGTITSTTITGNSSYGLAVEDCAESVSHHGGSNFIFLNGLDLPPGQAADITTNPTGLPVPEPPVGAPVPE